MICCLNPVCQKPLNPDGAETCKNCGEPLTAVLRGRYRPAKPIGQGGFGRTYLALDEDRLNARCVVKQFSPQVQGTKAMDKAVQLFNQEAVRLYELGEHSQIPTLLAYFEHDKRLYLVQQFIEGQNLFAELKYRGGFSEQQIREVLAGLLPVLKFIHEHQVIHRDITPANIIRRKQDGKLVLIDFGVAKQLKATEGSQAGTRIGTEGYAPMEQIRSGRAYPASDLYSLGATCLHLLTQTRPDNLYDPLRGCWIWREYLAKRGGSVSNELGQILDKLLKDLVGERYQSADEVLIDLNAAASIPAVPSQRSSAPVIGSTPRTSSPPAARPTAPASNPPPSRRRVSRPPTSRPPTSRPPTSRPPTSRPPTSRPPTSRPPISRPPLSSPPRPGPASSRSASTGNQFGRCILTLRGHSRWITSIAISPDGKTLASASLDKTVKVWDLNTGDLLFNLTGHSREVNAVAISPDGSMVVSGSDDDTIKIWHLQTGKLIRTLKEHARDVNSVFISRNGEILVSGSEDRTVKVWQLASGDLLQTLQGRAGMIKSVTASPDGQTVVSGGLDDKIKLWNADKGQLLHTLTGHFGSVNSVTIGPVGQILASGSKDRTVKLWNFETGELLHTLTGHRDAVNSVKISPNGQTLVSGSNDASIRLWKISTGELIGVLPDRSQAVESVAIAADGLLLASGGKDNTVKVWQVSL